MGSEMVKAILTVELAAVVLFALAAWLGWRTAEPRPSRDRWRRFWIWLTTFERHREGSGGSPASADVA